jgi:putative FmdB family regulatory protein
MPIYEFRCGGCKKKVSVFLRDTSKQATCPECGGSDLKRLVSRIAYHNQANVWTDEKGPPPSLGDDNYYSDPRNIGRYTEHRLKQLGIDMHSEEYSKTFSEVNEMIEKARDGEMPDKIKDI